MSLILNGTFAWYDDENMKKVCFDNDIVQTLKESKSYRAMI